MRHLNRNMRDMRELTEWEKQFLKGKGYRVKEIWEFEWKLLKKTQPEIANYVDGLDFIEPLNPRDAVSGSQTNAARLYYKVKEGDEIHYINFTLLYPAVNKQARYPRGYPSFIAHPGYTDISNYFGLIKCNVEPPYELYQPV